MRMLSRLFFIISSLLISVSAYAQSVRVEIITPTNHRHIYRNDNANSEEDRFIGTLYMVQCQVMTARLWLERAVLHDPVNQEAIDTLAILDTWAKQESMRVYTMAKFTGSRDVGDYHHALNCDPGNALAARELQRLMAQETIRIK